MIGEICKYLAIIGVSIISILSIIYVIKLMLIGPLVKTKKNKITWIAACITYIACTIVGMITIVIMLKG